ncbi:FAD-binding oxidoreductase [Mesorhizobium sp.]|uniref:FAD-binding protein n=1 Tax=Mesorhizobium sp. TaxID=1871066 RepID=UPI0025E296A6|nr:FAD-binding oxidoreductase [Mesorhizobium sp.]
MTVMARPAEVGSRAVVSAPELAPASIVKQKRIYGARPMMLSGWGRFPRVSCRVLEARGEEEVIAIIAENRSLIARGAGRSYGDAALNRGATLVMTASNHILDFNSGSGLLTCEAGVTLAEIADIFVPRGWFPMVTPGTKFVTVGGAIASDVHGKNHHRDGCFGANLAYLDLALADGRILRCSPTENADLFRATQGGMGLTGVILRAAFPLRAIETDLVRQETIRAENLAESMARLKEASIANYSVAWIDCLARGGRLGRSLVYRGEHVALDDLPKERKGRPYLPRGGRMRSVPFDFPGATLNRFTVAAFNELYYARGRPGTALVPLDPYFYPLDAIAHWDRIYGRAGFVQHQSVLPEEASRHGVETMLSLISARHAGSLLAVLKLCGAEGAGPLSFPMRGFTLALDFPGTTANLSLLLELDAIVADHGGRLYLAKDARAGIAVMERGYPRLRDFARLRDRFDPKRHFASVQSERLGL